jgi:Flp pilus assembly protein TadG
MRIKFGSQKGAALVESALILIPLLLITFGIIEFGVYLYNEQVITNASREGARAGIVASDPRLTPGPEIPLTIEECNALKLGPTDPPVSISCAVGVYCSNHLITFTDTPTSPHVFVNGYVSNASFGSNLTVQVNYEYSFLVLPNFILNFDNKKNMKAETVMKYE